jgi:hypothetical protein
MEYIFFRALGFILGFFLATLRAAVGLGNNCWVPAVAGQNGGGRISCRIVLGGPMERRPGLLEPLIAVIGDVLYGGAITTVIYNAAAGVAGGIELEVS